MSGPGLAAGPEFDRIRAFLAAANAGREEGIPVPAGDDAAVLEVPEGERVVLGVDACVEEVHFRRAWVGWEAVGWRATAAALSDLAAMAAAPVGALVTVLLPPELDRDVLESLASGVGACLRDTGSGLLGGDLSASPGGVALDVVAVGTASRPVPRSGARAGDELWVTGRLGAAATAVADWRSGLEPEARARRAFERPRPRLEEARWVAERVDVRALIDLSDGLAGDAAHVAAASGVGIEIDLASLPLAEVLEGFRSSKVATRRALAGGEDYELLLAAAPGEVEEIRDEFERRFDLELTLVGRAVEGEGVRGREGDGAPRPLPVAGYDHFRRE